MRTRNWWMLKPKRVIYILPPSTPPSLKGLHRRHGKNFRARDVEEGWECCPVDMTWLLCSRILCGCGCQHRIKPKRSVTIPAGNTNQTQLCLLDTKAKYLEATLKINLFSKAGVNKNTVSVCWMRLSQAINTHKGTRKVLCPQRIQHQAYDYVLSTPQETESKIVNYERCLLLTSIAGKCTNIRAWIGILNHLVSQIYQVKVI